ncbi:MAG: transglycosylase SLT domain-containing protein [Candidatus Berkelbacteria bacterium]|nr:transglycosylase SLT domain-containing protein [Candidatus Berkelbacteria bacterium]
MRRGNAIIAIVVGVLALIFFIFAIVYYAVFGLLPKLDKPTSGGTSINCAGSIDYVKDPQYLVWVKDAASKYLGGDEAILIALIQAESSWNPQAGAPTSSARGLGQFIDDSARGWPEFTGGDDKRGTIWPGGKIYDKPTFESHPDDARYDAKRSIYAAAHYFGLNMEKYNNDPIQAYMKGYHKYSNAKEEAEARIGADRMMDTYNKLKNSGNCSQTGQTSSATPSSVNAPPGTNMSRCLNAREIPISIPAKNKRLAHTTLVAKLELLWAKNKIWRVTEACPPTSPHNDRNHYNGRAIDIAIFPQNKATSQNIDQLLKDVREVGFNDILDEYRNDTQYKTSGHIHLEWHGN